MVRRSPIEHLRWQLATSLGLGSALLLGACGTLASGGGSEGADEGGVTTDPSDGGSSVDGTEGPGSTATSTDPSTEPPDPDPDPDPDPEPEPEPKHDLQQPADTVAFGDCITEQTDASALAENPECPITLDDDGFCWTELYWGCVEPLPGESCAELCPEGDCIVDWTNCQGDNVYDLPVEVCGPYERDGLCCTLAELPEICGSDGRPFVVAGCSRQARLRPVHGEPARPTRRVAEHLASRWSAIAAAEHASIASFAAFAARLLALGAPPSLVRGALAAAADEARHAELALELASVYAGVELEFDGLATQGAAADESFEDTILAVVREGCIGETLAALELETAARGCQDPRLAARLREVAEDEGRHAILAWRTLAWGLGRAPGLAPKVASFIRTLELGGSIESPGLDEVERAELRAHGCLCPDERRELLVRGVRELLEPCARALVSRAGSGMPVESS